MEEQSLWGNLALEEAVETPVSILKSQAALLAKMTSNVINAYVKLATRSLTEEFQYDFNLLVPVLDNYVFTLFRIRHGMRLYPVTIEFIYTSGKANITCPDRETYVGNVEMILSSDGVHSIIRSLLAQARAVR